jgi:outer membrane protein TolC
MDIRKLAVIVLLFGAGAGAAAQPTLGGSVESLLEYAKGNPEYAAMRHEAAAAAERVYPAGAFADPLFRIELQNITNAGSDAAPSLNPSKVGSTKYTVLQPIPFFGKRDLKRGVAAADAQQAEGRAAMTWAELAARIKDAYAKYYVVVQNQIVTREILDLMTRLETIADVRYSGGLVPQQDAIRAQVERTSMRSELILLESEEHGVLHLYGFARFRHPQDWRRTPSSSDSVATIRNSSQKRLASVQPNSRARLPTRTGIPISRSECRRSKWARRLESGR